MSLALNVMLVVTVLIFLFLIYKSIKKKLISVKYSIMWIVSGLLMLVSILTPNLLNSIANLIGFKVVSNMIFLVGFLILLFITFSLTVIVSIQKMEITTLVQELGILKSYIKEYEKKN